MPYSIFQPKNNAASIFSPRARRLGTTGADMLSGIGQALMSQQPGPYPVSPFPAIAQGLQYGQQMGRQRDDDLRQAAMDDMRQKQFGMQEAQFAMEQEKNRKQEEAAKAQAAALEEAFKTLSPADQAIARANPDEFMKQVIGQKFAKPQGPSSGIAKIQDDLAKGFITPEQAQAAIRKETYIAPAASTTINLGPTGINYGEPEAGLAWARNPNGSVKLDERGAPMAVPYQGSKAYIAATEKTDKKTEQGVQAARSSDIVLQDIDRAIAKTVESPMMTTGIGAQLLSGIGGTAAKDVSELVTTIRSNIGFDRLQQMREASPTGGALGPVSDFENKNLQAVLGSLEQSQGPKQFLQNLARLEETYMDIVHGKGNRPAGWQPRDVDALLGGESDPNIKLKKKYGLD